MIPRLANAGRALVIPGLLALGLVAPSPVAAGNPCFRGDLPPVTSGPGTDIKLMPCAFEPTVTFVEPGTEVTFYNGPDFVHILTGANQVWGSPDGKVHPNSTISYTFDEPGIYPYACVLHPGMSGAIVVGDVASGLGAGTGGVTGGLAEPAEAAATAAPVAPDPETAAEIAAAEAAAAASLDQVSEAVPTATTGVPVELIALGIGGVLLAGGVGLGLAYRRRTIARPLVRAD